MPPLPNARHERFALNLAEGHSISESYTLAGYSKNTGNAARLNANESVRARVAELQAETAVNSKVTIESICKELDQATAVAKERGQANAMVSASQLRARLAGLLVERHEVGPPGSFEGAENWETIANELIHDRLIDMGPAYAVEVHDREVLLGLLTHMGEQVSAFFDEIQARPLLAKRVDPRALGLLPKPR